MDEGLITEHKPMRSWAIVEIMGHQTYCGELSEEVIGGQSFVRIDIPETESGPAFTKLFGAGSIYAITPTTEQVARMMAERHVRHPVSEYDLPAELRAKLRRLESQTDVTDDDEEDDDDRAF
ncbi:hypothetical protein KOR42_53440 [Thalassoglobus neptunius]|uniref:Uncharacterized protein n=1 Tax=Thalassoglobus neptunius TaxID=1938619 RepID=A0A5C5V8S1_9PLAN|nr:hypothetical protein [Thalassoglobus neptunius]TWT34994.1 hypothetical protein KOR42_53440 [Thalassoglobus neptunius]